MLAGLFLFTRLFNLTLHGLQYDEASYIYLGGVIGSDWNQRYLSASWVGKQPLHPWLLALAEKLLPDPLVAARLVSVMAGAFTLLALWLLARRLFSWRVAMLAALLYILCPYPFLFDRQALADSLLAAATTWIIYLGVRLVDRQDIATVLGMGVAFGAALLTKSVSQAFPLLLPAALLVLPRQELTRERVGRWFVAILGGLLIGFLIYYIAFGSSETSKLISQHEQQYGRYVMSLSELLAFPIQKWVENTTSVIQWLIQFGTVPLTLTAMIALLAAPWLGPRAWLLGLWVLLPIVGQIVIAARFFDRYILFSLPPLFILMACLWEVIYERMSAWAPIAQQKILRWPAALGLAISLVTALFLLPVAQEVILMTDVETANRATSGFYGLSIMRDFIAERAKGNTVYVVGNFTPSPVEDGITVVLRNVPNAKMLRVLPSEGKLSIFDPITRQLYPKEYFQDKEVYYTNNLGAEKDSWLAGHLELVRSFSNARGDDSAVALYRIRFDNSFR